MTGRNGSTTLQGIGTPAMTHSHPCLLGYAIAAVLAIGGPAAALAAPANPTRASFKESPSL